MGGLDIQHLLSQALDELCRADTVSEDCIENALLAMGCAPTKAELLADYLPAACGRAVLREIGITPSSTYSRANGDGSWGPQTAFADDPLWGHVETFVEKIRTDPQRRKQFGIAARISAEVDAINNAVNAGKSLTDLKGSHFASVFLAPLKRQV